MIILAAPGHLQENRSSLPLGIGGLGGATESSFDCLACCFYVPLYYTDWQECQNKNS